MQYSGQYLDATITLLKHTSLFVSCFRDKRPVIDASDARLQDIKTVGHYFIDWEDGVSKCSTFTPSEKEKSLISQQTRDDIQSVVLGFDYLCKSRIERSGYSGTPAYINSDPIENIFCPVQGLIHNGLNTNPTYCQFSETLNSTILSQSTISRKSNTGGLTHYTDPISFYQRQR
jgi:hypothetical protein